MEKENKKNQLEEKVCIMIRYDDYWCDKAKGILNGIDSNLKILIPSLNRRYSYEECNQFDLIASCTTGTDHVDNRDVPLISLKGEADFLSGVFATAEHTMFLIGSLVRKIPFAHQDVCRGNWDREKWQGVELRGKTLGIIGMGRLGKQIARYADAFGMFSIACDKDGNLEFVLRNADIISVHIPLNDETRVMFGVEQFKLMKPSSYFINTSRGQIVDEDALFWALSNKEIAGAALDVMCNEPNINPKLLEYARANSNLILSPHLGGNTAESREKTQIFLANRLKEVCLCDFSKRQ